MSRIIAWFGENESALSGMAAMAMLVGLAWSFLRHRTRSLLVGVDKTRETAATTPGPREAKASIAIETFVCTGGEEANGLGVAVRENALESLSNQTGVSVKNDVASADYVASGSIQAMSGRYRATVRLVDRDSGESFWSGRFEGDLTDPFEAQDELAARVCNALRFNVLTRESEKAGASGLVGFEERLSRAAMLMLRSDPSEWDELERLVDAAYEERPDDFMVRAMRASARMREVIVGWREMTPEDAAASLENASKAVQLNDRSDFAHMILAAAHLYVDHDVAAARRECERSLELNRYYKLAIWGLGQCVMSEGDYAEGARLCEEAGSTDAHFPSNHRLLSWAAMGWFAAGETERALETAQRAEERFRDVPRSLLVLAAAAMRLGEEDLARSTAARIREKYPTLVVSELARWPIPDDGPFEAFIDALRRAGLPETVGAL